MKKILVRVLAMTLVLMTMFALCTEAFAAETGKKYPDFGESAVFYAKTKDSINNKVKVYFGKGYISALSSYCCKKHTYGSYEAIVYYKNAAGTWKWESQKTCYRTSSKELTLAKANTEYKIVVRSKTASVVWDSYVKNGYVTPCTKCASNASVQVIWKGLKPAVYVKTISGIKSIE